MAQDQRRVVVEEVESTDAIEVFDRAAVAAHHHGWVRVEVHGSAGGATRQAVDRPGEKRARTRRHRLVARQRRLWIDASGAEHAHGAADSSSRSFVHAPSFTRAATLCVYVHVQPALRVYAVARPVRALPPFQYRGEAAQLPCRPSQRPRRATDSAILRVASSIISPSKRTAPRPSP